MTGVSIRAACHDDVPTLDAALGQQEYFADRIQRQEHGRGTLLVAWRGQEVAGAVYVWRSEAEEQLIRTYLPGVPLLTHLEVLPRYRNHGIGTALIRRAEDLLWADSGTRVALAVAAGNERAAALYHRLGYHDWEVEGIETVTCYHHETINGITKPVSENCRVLVKKLQVLRTAVPADPRATAGEHLSPDYVRPAGTY